MTKSVGGMQKYGMVLQKIMPKRQAMCTFGPFSFSSVLHPLPGTQVLWLEL